jgi:uncharacterized protein (UPF0218 family)
MPTRTRWVPVLRTTNPAGELDRDVLAPLAGTAALQQLDLIGVFGFEALAVLDLVDHSVRDHPVRWHS